jgi:hypothetical protein
MSDSDIISKVSVYVFSNIAFFFSVFAELRICSCCPLKDIRKLCDFHGDINSACWIYSTERGCATELGLFFNERFDLDRFRTLRNSSC